MEPVIVHIRPLVRIDGVLRAEADAVVLIVSEESGAISLAYDSKLYYDLTTDNIESELTYLLKVKAKTQNIETSEGSAS